MIAYAAGIVGAVAAYQRAVAQAKAANRGVRVEVSPYVTPPFAPPKYRCTHCSTRWDRATHPRCPSCGAPE